MRKIFTLFTALMVALIVNATSQTIGPAEGGRGTNLIKTAIHDSPTDTIILKSGTYFEDKSYGQGYVDFKNSIVILAEANATPILKAEAYYRIYNGAKVKIKGVTFNGGEQGSYSYFIRFYDGNSENGLELEDCTFTSIDDDMIVCESGKSANFKYLVLKNCHFTGSTGKNAIKLQTSTPGYIQIENCQFEGFSEPIIVGSSAAHLDSCVIKNTDFKTSITATNALNWSSSNKLNRLYVDDCEFKGFTGVVISASTLVDTCIVKDCHFHGNTVANAINLGGVAKKVIISGSEFEDFKNNVIASAAVDSCKIVDCKFHDNKTAGGALSVGGAAKKIIVSGSTFKDFKGNVITTSAAVDTCEITNSKFQDNAVASAINLGGAVKYFGVKGSTFTDFTGGTVLATSAAVDSCIVSNCTFSGGGKIFEVSGTTSKSLRLEGCEVSSFAGDIIKGSSATHLDSCIIDNCYFHNNEKSAISFEKSNVSAAIDKQTCSKLIVKNSTFANNDVSPTGKTTYASVIDLLTYNYDTVNVIVRVDHCTFYNNLTENTDYSAIRVRISKDVIVSNCIFAHPTSYDRYATTCFAGTITNCLTHNLSHSGSTHRQQNNKPTLTDNFTADPLFKNVATGYSYKGDWTTTPIAISPARGAGTDGSDLGDPRWYSAEVLPETDFSSPYTLSGAVAQLKGNVWYDSENKEIYYDNKAENGTATWKIHVTRACYLGASFHSGSESGRNMQIEIVDAENHTVGSPMTEVNTWSTGDRTLTGTVHITSAGDYTVKLTNSFSHSSVHISNLKLSLVSEPITIGSTGWATFCSNYALDFTGLGVEAYIVTGHSGTTLEKTQLSSTVPANTPLLLKADAGSYEVPVVSSSETSTTGNKLVRGTGSGVGYEEGKTRYVLMAKNETTAEFQLLAQDGASAVVGTNKAYLQFNEAISLAPAALRLVDEENNATNIDAIDATEDAVKFIENGKLYIKKNNVVYDMMGTVIR